MQKKIHITFRHIRKIDEVEQLINDRAQRVEGIHPHIISCNVTCEQVQRSQKSNNVCGVRIEMHIPPAHDIVVKREREGDDYKLVLLTLVNEAFDVVERQVKEAKEKTSAHVKNHPENMANGIVTKLFREEGKDYGFLESIDGYEVYFHKHSVLNDAFDTLEVGSAVRYIEQNGEKGPQASTVQVVAKARLH